MTPKNKQLISFPLYVKKVVAKRLNSTGSENGAKSEFAKKLGITPQLLYKRESSNDYFVSELESGRSAVFKLIGTFDE